VAFVIMLSGSKVAVWCKPNHKIIRQAMYWGFYHFTNQIALRDNPGIINAIISSLFRAGKADISNPGICTFGHYF